MMKKILLTIGTLVLCTIAVTESYAAVLQNTWPLMFPPRIIGTISIAIVDPSASIEYFYAGKFKLSGVTAGQKGTAQVTSVPALTPLTVYHVQNCSSASIPITEIHYASPQASAVTEKGSGVNSYAEIIYQPDQTSLYIGGTATLQSDQCPGTYESNGTLKWCNDGDASHTLDTCPSGDIKEVGFKTQITALEQTRITKVQDLVFPPWILNINALPYSSTVKYDDSNAAMFSASGNPGSQTSFTFTVSPTTVYLSNGTSPHEITVSHFVIACKTESGNTVNGYNQISCTSSTSGTANVTVGAMETIPTTINQGGTYTNVEPVQVTMTQN